MWVLWWKLRVPLWLKLFPHTMHLYGFSPVWALWCVLNVLLWVKLFPHSMHLYGFSPVWILSCELKLLLWLKLFPHCRHLYCLSPLGDVSREVQSLCIVMLFPCSMRSLCFSSGWTLSSLLSSEAPLNVYLPGEPFVLPFSLLIFSDDQKCTNINNRRIWRFLFPSCFLASLLPCQLDIHLMENSGGDYKADILQTSWQLKADRERLKESSIFISGKRSLRG